MSKNNTNDKIRFFPMSTIREGRKIEKFTSVCVITNGPYVKGLVIHASPITCHTFPLSSSPSLSLTIPLHHLMLRNENSLYPPPLCWWPTDVDTNMNGCQKLWKWLWTWKQPKCWSGQPLWMWAAHPILNLTLPLVVKGCVHTQNVKAGTQSQSDDCSTIKPWHKNIDS